MKVILKALVGSHLYGLDTPESDEDFLGVYVAPTDEVLGLRKPTPTHVTKNPDMQIHEVEKYINLAASANPTVLELMWCPEYVVKEYEGSLLVNYRHSFLCTKRVRAAFAGYAKQQKDKLVKRQEEGLVGFNPTVKNRYEKHARHCFRLFQQGADLLTTGDINPKVKDRDFLFEVGKMSVEEIAQLFDETDAQFKTLPSVLPDNPDWERLNWLLLTIRKNNQ